MYSQQAASEAVAPTGTRKQPNENQKQQPTGAQQQPQNGHDQPHGQQGQQAREDKQQHGTELVHGNRIKYCHHFNNGECIYEKKSGRKCIF